MGNLKYFALHIIKLVVRLCYNVFSKLRKLDDNKFVFVLSRSEKLDGNLLYIHRALREQAPQAKIHLIQTDNKMNLNLLKEAFIISNAKYVILDDYFMTLYLIKPKRHLKVIQLWHAAGAFKKFGYSTVNMKFGPDKKYLEVIPVHSNYTHVYVSTSRVLSYYAEAFNMSKDLIYGIGTPKIDLFTNEHLKKEAFNEIRTYKRFDYLNEKTVILIAPTYRAKGSQGESDLELIHVLTEVANQLNDHIALLLKLHPYTHADTVESLSAFSNIIIETNLPTNHCMLIADAFITDYSSAVFDFSILGKPIAHFVPDYKKYEQNRGFYQKLEDVSDGDIIQKKEDLIRWINEREKAEAFDTTRMIKRSFDATENSSAKIVKHFISE